MANILAPFGFRWAQQLSAVAPNCAQSMRRISSSNTTAIFHGDPVVSESTGYIQQAAAGTTQIAGIFVGCKYISQSLGRTVWNNYWPGADAASDPEAYIINDPNAVFTVQSNGAAIALAAVMENANFAIGTGNTRTGMSGATLDASTLSPSTTTLPFRVIGYAGDGIFSAVGPGSDPTSDYNYVYVTLNNQDFKVLTGQ